MTNYTTIKVRLPGNYRTFPRTSVFAEREFRRLYHSGQIEPDSVDFPYGLEELYLAQMRIANAAFRLVSFHDGQALPPERLTATLDVRDVLRACGLDVNTRSVFHGGKL